jgi:hypothetical protein
VKSTSGAVASAASEPPAADGSPLGSPATTLGTAGTKPASAAVPGVSPETEQPWPESVK